jgi:hypothetical protein
MVKNYVISRISSLLIGHGRALAGLMHTKLWIVVCSVWVDCLQLGIYSLRIGKFMAFVTDVSLIEYDV